MRLFKQQIPFFLVQIAVKHVPAAATALLVIQRYIGPAEQLIVVAHIATGNGHTHGNRQREAFEVTLKRPMDAVDQRTRVDGAFHAQEELVAAHASHDVLTAHAFLQALREVLQHAIAELVAVGVVGLLEEIQIAQRQHMTVAMTVARLPEPKRSAMTLRAKAPLTTSVSGSW